MQRKQRRCCQEVLRGDGIALKVYDTHADYYESILQVEKAMDEEVAKELERESDQETALKEDK
uniref:Uncharacterized protein n=1 Tax=Nelumbo nucifera TaxID=4432 RepID=A0A822XHT5_NELNU|nr:TPA_asm: hypothetical protein HUJ06_021403 [Nelumbo nucifera]